MSASLFSLRIASLRLVVGPSLPLDRLAGHGEGRRMRGSIIDEIGKPISSFVPWSLITQEGFHDPSGRLLAYGGPQLLAVGAHPPDGRVGTQHLNAPGGAHERKSHWGRFTRIGVATHCARCCALTSHSTKPHACAIGRMVRS